MISSLHRWYSDRARSRRGEVFMARLKPTPDDTMLDLGGGDGSHIQAICNWTRNVTVADALASELANAEAKGFAVVLLDGTRSLPFPDKSFDIVFCNSVIEHVTGDKEQVRIWTDGSAFSKQAESHQAHFASEIDRIAKAYFVQTPYRHFPIESHTWTPMVLESLPRGFRLRVHRYLRDRSWWPRRVTNVDWRLLTIRDMKRLFPRAEVVTERSFGLVKSLIAVKDR
jgi:SAM-dependent methyltransferase